MTLDLKKVFATEGSTIEIRRELDLSNTEHAGVFPLKKPVSVEGLVSNRASIVTLCLKITYEFSAPCDRCGTDCTRRHTVDLVKSLAVAIEGEDSDTIITVPGMKLDVDELAFSEVILSLPTKHLCSEECRGICPKCGKDLNGGPCGCPTKEIDPRLSKLVELLN